MSIFINYRRDDNAVGYSRNLADDLRAAFGDKQVFRDIRGIPPGVDFAEHLRQRLAGCKVMLALIGKQWLLKNEHGERRIDNPDDWVRLEIVTALKKPGTLVIPVLVAGARPLSSADNLPDDLKPLAGRQAIELTDKNWDRDVADLVEALTQHGIKPSRKKRGGEEGETPGIWKRWKTWAWVALGTLFLGALAEEFSPADDYELSETGFQAEAMPVHPTQARVETTAATNTQQAPQSMSHDLSGRWIGQDGMYYDLSDNGAQIGIVEYNPFGVQTAAAMGQRNGDVVDFSFNSTNGPGVGRLKVSSDGNTINSTIQWQMSGMTANGQLHRVQP